MAPTLKSTVNKLEKSLINAQQVLAKAQALLVVSEAAKAAKAAAKRKAVDVSPPPEKRVKFTKEELLARQAKARVEKRSAMKAAGGEPYEALLAKGKKESRLQRSKKQVVKLIALGCSQQEAVAALETANGKLCVAKQVLKARQAAIADDEGMLYELD